MADESSKRRLITDLLLCSVELEELTAKLYETLAEKLEGAKAIAARHIARESWNHARTLREILGLLGIERVRPECERVIGENYIKIKNILLNIKNMDPESVADFLSNIECSLGEETYHALMLPLVKDISDEIIINIIIDEIIDEERFHGKLVKRMFGAKNSNELDEILNVQEDTDGGEVGEE